MEDKKIEFTTTHLIEVGGKVVKASEDIKEKGFHYYHFEEGKDPKLVFIAARDTKVIDVVKPKSLFTPLELMGFFVTLDRTIKLWIWKPSPQITTHELATLLPFLFTSGSIQGIKEAEMDLLGVEWRNHFELRALPPQLVNSKEYHEFVKYLRQ